MTNTMQYVLPRLLTGIFLALFHAWPFILLNDPLVGEGKDPKKPKYPPLLRSAQLLGMILTILLLGLLSGSSHEIQRMFLVFFQLFLTLSLYYALVLLLMPFFRRRISARACAFLWAIPNILCIYFCSSVLFLFRSPKLVIPVSPRVLQSLSLVWFIGFAIVAVYKIAEHLLFRRWLLSRTVPAQDPQLLNAWQTALQASRTEKAPYHLGVCPALQTPLSVGLFRNVTWVVLPQKSYSSEELALILRHEIIHIERQDNWFKFSQSMCVAVCWFNPLVWLAAKRSSEDVELSCDETVLLEEPTAARKQYADLLLQTSGDERGFTTCLSASAKAMRYRLKNIMQPTARSGGALPVFALTLLLLSSCGFTALAYNRQSAADGIFDGLSLSLYSVEHIDRSGSAQPSGVYYEVKDETAFLDYLSQMPLYELSRQYDRSDSREIDYYTLSAPYGKLYITLYDRFVSVTKYSAAPALRYNDAFRNAVYYLPQQTDWEFLNHCIAEFPGTEPDSSDYDGSAYTVSLTPGDLWEVQNGTRVNADSIDENFRSELAIHCTLEHCTLSLHSAHTDTGPCTVSFALWNSTEQQTYNYPAFPESVSTELPFFPALCTVTAQYTDENGKVYEAEYRFSINADAEMVDTAAG